MMNSSGGLDVDSINRTVYLEAFLAIEPDHFSPEFSEHFKLLLHVLYNLVLFGGIVGNSLVLYAIYSVPRMRTVTNFLLANLALGDLLIVTVCVPFTYLSMVYGYWPFGHFLCYVVSPFNAIGVLVSAFTLIALAIEKYVAILHPLAPRMRKSRVSWVIGVIWVAAGATSAPIALVSEVRDDVIGNQSFPSCREYGWESEHQELTYSLTLMIVQYFFPLTVMAFTYTRITCVVCGIQHDRRGSTVSNGEINLNRNTRTDNRSRKAVLLTLAVVAGYTLAWFPSNLTYIILRHYPSLANLPEFRYIFIACHWLAMSHCFYNPVIYAFINSSFKNAFKDVYYKIYCSFKSEVDRMNSSRRSRYLSSFTTTRNSSTVKWKSYYNKIATVPEPFTKVSEISPGKIISHNRNADDAKPGTAV